MCFQRVNAYKSPLPPVLKQGINQKLSNFLESRVFPSSLVSVIYLNQKRRPSLSLWFVRFLPMCHSDHQGTARALCMSHVPRSFLFKMIS